MEITFQEIRIRNIEQKMFRQKHKKYLKFFFSPEAFQFSKDGHIMPASITPGQVLSGSVSAQAKGLPSNAVLSNVAFSTSDPTVCTIINDPNNAPAGFIITGVGSGTNITATVSATATATETSGATEQINSSGDAANDVITCSLAVVVPPPADSLIFNFGTPVAPPVPGQALKAVRPVTPITTAATVKV